MKVKYKFLRSHGLYIGGENCGGGKGWSAKGKSIVFGIVERGGNVFTKVIRNVRQSTIEPIVHQMVAEGSTVSTDEAPAYQGLRDGYDHVTVNRSKDEWVVGKHHANPIESFGSILKRSIRGTHVSVSAKHLPKYLGEFEYRDNMRKHPEKMLGCLRLGF